MRAIQREMIGFHNAVFRLRCHRLGILEGSLVMWNSEILNWDLKWQLRLPHQKAL